MGLVERGERIERNRRWKERMEKSYNRGMEECKEVEK